MKPLYSFVAMLCISLLFSCAPEIEPIPELEYSSSSGISSSNVVVLGSSSSLSSSGSNVSVISSSSRVSSSSVVIPSSSSSVKPSSGTYCLDYDWQECTLSNGNPCPDYSTPSNSCPSGWNSSSSSILLSSSSVIQSSSSVSQSSSSSLASTSGTFKDDRDSKIYKWVKIGEQVWMAENLNYNESGSKCGDGSSLSDANTSTCDTYGRLYDWITAMDGSASSAANPSGVKGICPAGWHLPSDAEWTTLINFVGNSSTKLKSTSGWNISSGNGTDDYGFAALPGDSGRLGGFNCTNRTDVSLPDGRYCGGDSKIGSWWKSNESSISNSYHLNLSNIIHNGIIDKSYVLSVRCVRD